MLSARQTHNENPLESKGLNTMRLVTVPEPPGFVATCLTCGKVIPANAPKVADLDGEAFKAYYHQTCQPTQTEQEDEAQ